MIFLLSFHIVFFFGWSTICLLLLLLLGLGLHIPLECFCILVFVFSQTLQDKVWLSFEAMTFVLGRRVAFDGDAHLLTFCFLSSADATIASQATGAMSWAFISSLKKNPQQSYVQLLNSIRDELCTRYTQKPQLSSSHPLGKASFSQACLFQFCSYLLSRLAKQLRYVTDSSANK